MSFRIITVSILISIVSAWSCNNDIDHQDDGIVVIAAFDGLSNHAFRNEGAAAHLKTIHQVAETGVFADGMLTAFPGVTTNGHAALYTGTFGNKNGITSGNLRLPRAEHTVFDHISGFHSSLLRVEPIWVTAARQGKKVLAIQTTQMYPFLDHVTAADAPKPPALVTGYGPEILSYPRIITPENATLMNTQPDILLVLPSDVKWERLISPLESLNYQYWNENPRHDCMFFVKRLSPQGKAKTQHVYVRTSDDANEMLIFDDIVV